MNNSLEQTMAIDRELDLSSSCEFITKINYKNQNYCIISLNDITDAVNLSCLVTLPELSKLENTFSEVGRFAFNHQCFLILEILPNTQNRDPDIADLLSARELQIATLVALGHANKQIARQLCLSEWTVSTYLRRIFAKLGVDSRAAMVYHCAPLIHHLRTLETTNV